MMDIDLSVECSREITRKERDHLCSLLRRITEFDPDVVVGNIEVTFPFGDPQDGVTWSAVTVQRQVAT